ncbi:uncharacterized protein OCT59_027672 [Rhizophagus irregularis]|uniref:uncharacterized protein n=1 Tax=Rhizophagus irregularis TaxID=588596 RepID=UPI00332F7E63|nr:hypothetical protein OCT59_027672 [Rhizophagus irregularis]
MTTDNASNMNVFGQHFTQMLSNNHGNILSRHGKVRRLEVKELGLGLGYYLLNKINLQVDSTCQHDAIQVFQVNKCLGVAKFTINPTGNRLNPEIL